MPSKKRAGNKKKGSQSNFAKLSIFQPNKYKFKKTCPLSAKGAPEVDYKNIRLLKKHLAGQYRLERRRIWSGRAHEVEVHPRNDPSSDEGRFGSCALPQRRCVWVELAYGLSRSSCP